MTDDASILYGILSGSLASTKPTESLLLSEWFRLQSTFPEDGWDGAAEARAAHHSKVLEVERRLREAHERSGSHGPVRRHQGVSSGRCLCGVDIPQSRKTPMDSGEVLRLKETLVKADKPVPYTSDQESVFAQAIVVAEGILEGSRQAETIAASAEERGFYKKKSSTWAKTLAWWKGHRDSGRVAEGLFEAEKLATRLAIECAEWWENTADPTYRKEAEFWDRNAKRWKA